MDTKNIVCQDCNSINAVTIKNTLNSAICTNCEADLDDPFPLEVSDTSCTLHILKNDIPILVDFYSPACGPCMAMYDDYEDAALAFGLQVRFLKINADEHQEVAKKYGVSGLPTIIAFHQGEEVNRISSQLSQTQLNLWAQSLIS